jgi:peptidoglycan/xylan/chitin deacetylase (PgdA/CDA1 family)
MQVLHAPNGPERAGAMPAGATLLARAARGAANWLSPAGPSGTLSILIFHRVLPAEDGLMPDVLDASRFDVMLSWIGRAFNVLPLEQAICDLDERRLPARALALTFDDGYADNHDVALPLLQRHRMDATFFVASGFLDGGRMWNDTVIEAMRRFQGEALDLSGAGLGRVATATVEEKRLGIEQLLARLKYLPLAEREAQADRIAGVIGAELPRDLMMSSVQVRALRSSGMTIGGHTSTHPILAELDETTAREQIVRDKETLESILGEKLRLFAYPNGRPGRDYRREHARMVADAGYDGAVSTSPGVARNGIDPYQLPRFTPWDRTPARFVFRLAANLRRVPVTA